jgi:hypothetical protein
MMKTPDFTSRAHPFGVVALDGPAGGETAGLTAAERDALAQLAGAAAQTVRDQYGRPIVTPDRQERSPWMLAALVAGAVVVVVFILRKR